MSGLLSKPDLPPPPPPPPTPAIDYAVQQQTADADRQRRLQLAAGGRASTVLTSGLGDTSTPTTASQTLLGG
jgi:hypothetical protein